MIVKIVKTGDREANCSRPHLSAGGSIEGAVSIECAAVKKCLSKDPSSPLFYQDAKRLHGLDWLIGSSYPRRPRRPRQASSCNATLSRVLQLQHPQADSRHQITINRPKLSTLIRPQHARIFPTPDSCSAGWFAHTQPEEHADHHRPPVVCGYLGGHACDCERASRDEGA